MPCSGSRLLPSASLADDSDAHSVLPQSGSHSSTDLFLSNQTVLQPDQSRTHRSRWRGHRLVGTGHAPLRLRCSSEARTASVPGPIQFDGSS